MAPEASAESAVGPLPPRDRPESSARPKTSARAGSSHGPTRPVTREVRTRPHHARSPSARTRPVTRAAPLDRDMPGFREPPFHLMDPGYASMAAGQAPPPLFREWYGERVAVATPAAALRQARPQRGGAGAQLLW